MKKLSLFLAVLMILMTFPVMFMTSVSAVSVADAAAAAAGTPFKVGTEYYATYTEAFDVAIVAGNANTIEILSDVEITSADRWAPDWGKWPQQDVVINGNGFTVTDNYGNGAYGWKIDNQLVYTVTVKDVTLKTNGFWQLKGKIVCEDVTVDSKNTNAVTGAVLIQADTDVTFTGNSAISSNPSPSAAHNSANPVFAFNAASNATLTIAGNTKIDAYNTLFFHIVDGKVVKGSAPENVTVNIKDNAVITEKLNSVETTEGNILVSGEIGAIEINIYGGTIDNSNGTVLYLNDDNCKGTVANIYGGTIKGNVSWNTAKADLNYYGGNVRLNGVDYVAEAEYVEGASLRTATDTTGLRFRSIIPAEMMTSITENAVSYKIGTIILPYEYVDYTAKGELTHASLDTAGLPYLDIEAVNGLATDAEGNVTVNAAIVNIKDINLEKDFIATAYVQWTDAKGATWTSYSNALPTENDARNAVEVASAALADVKDATEGAYTNAVTTYMVDGALVTGGATKYAKLTQSEMTNISKLIPQA